MQRLSTTVVALVGPGSPAGLQLLEPAANVRVVHPDEGPPLDRAVAAWREASGTHLPFFVHDADPLAAVGAAWRARFEGTGAAGQLEVATAELLARGRARSLDLPDFYLVAGVDDLSPLERHWYLGVLGALAPRRVALGEVADTPGRSARGGLAAELRRLPAGRWWPPLDEVVAAVDVAVPDLVALDAAGSDPASPLVSGLVSPGDVRAIRHR
jgi:hypothetical protein